VDAKRKEASTPSTVSNQYSQHNKAEEDNGIRHKTSVFSHTVAGANKSSRAHAVSSFNTRFDLLLLKKGAQAADQCTGPQHRPYFSPDQS